MWCAKNKGLRHENSFQWWEWKQFWLMPCHSFCKHYKNWLSFGFSLSYFLFLDINVWMCTLNALWAAIIFFLRFLASQNQNHTTNVRLFWHVWDFNELHFFYFNIMFTIKNTITTNGFSRFVTVLFDHLSLSAIIWMFNKYQHC